VRDIAVPSCFNVGRESANDVARYTPAGTDGYLACPGRRTTETKGPFALGGVAMNGGEGLTLGRTPCGRPRLVGRRGEKRPRAVPDSTHFVGPKVDGRA